MDLAVVRKTFAADAVTALATTATPITAADHIPSAPGLYAIWGADAVWESLGLSWAAGVPLYVGKSESSLRGRELDTHFDMRGGRSKTGSSTVRRSFAALLADRLELRAIPRNTLKPGYFSNYSLQPDDDRRLTAWMHANLELSVWTPPAGAEIELGEVETGVIQHWDPPVNIDKTPTPRTRLKAARARLARQAAEGSAESQPI
jgi:hypothetical protein